MSEMASVREALEERGYRFERHGDKSKHERIVGPDGQPVRENGVPVLMPGTPGDWRAVRNLIAQLRRVGALDYNPQRGRHRQRARGGGGTKLTVVPPQPAAELRRREHHDRLVAEMETFMRVRAGGWGRSREVAAGALLWMGAREVPGRPLTLEYAEQQLTKLCCGQMLPFAEEQAWQMFLNEINQDDDPLLRWIEISREARGL